MGKPIRRGLASLFRVLSDRGVLALAFALTVATGSVATVGYMPGDEPALKAATRDLCRRRLVFLGDQPSHGDGHTDAFKVALVERLVTRCGFSAMAWEASFYEWSHLARPGVPVTDKGVAAAIGGLWRYDREVMPLIPFISRRMRAGTLRIGGLDNQLGVFDALYANDVMLDELTAPLLPPRRSECREALRRRSSYDYPETAPYGARQRDQLLECVAEMRVISAPGDAGIGINRVAMLENVAATLKAEKGDAAAIFAARDRQMFNNLVLLIKHWPKNAKVIVWCATVHAARPVRDMTGTMQPADLSITTCASNLGGSVAHHFGRKAFVLGFTAQGGVTRLMGAGKKPVPIDPPAPGALEAVNLPDGHEAAYIGPSTLKRAGTRPGSVYAHRVVTVRWSDSVDGVVVFRREWAAHSTRPGYAVE